MVLHYITLDSKLTLIEIIKIDISRMSIMYRDGTWFKQDVLKQLKLVFYCLKRFLFVLKHWSARYYSKIALMNKRIFKQLFVFISQNLRIQKVISEDSWFEGEGN
jgi:hypothetical protein